MLKHLFKIDYKILYISLGVLLILILLNPSYTSFKEYTTDVNTTRKRMICRRISNYLIFSVYQSQIVVWDEGEYVYEPSKKYIGIWMNFYPVK